MTRLMFCAAFLLLGGMVVAAPPDVPTDLKVEPGQLVRITVKGDAAPGVLRNFKDDEAFFAELVSPKGSRQFVFQAPPNSKRATYVIGWWTKGETDGTATTITVGGGVIPPGPDPKPKDPPPPPTGLYYFLIVRPDGPASPVFTKTMGLPEWAALRAAGHLVKDRTASEAAAPAIGVVIPAAQLPAVVTLSVAADGKSSTIVRAAVPLPTTGAGVLDLLKGVR